jgi:predicted Zn-dependent protease
MISRQRAREIVDWVFAASSAAETEIVLSSERGNSIRLAECAPSEQNALDEVNVWIRLIHKGKQGRSSATSFSEEALQRCLDQAFEAAAFAPEMELFPLETQVRGDDGGLRWEKAEALADHPQETKLDQLGAYLQEGSREGVQLTGFYDTGGSSITYATSAGCFRHGFEGKASFSSTAILEPGGAGVGSALVLNGDLDASEIQEVGRTAILKAKTSRRPHSLDPGEYPVLLEPRAVGDLLMFMAWAGLGGRPFLDGSSFLSEKIGEQVLSEKITILDDVWDPRFHKIGFDYEGQPTQSVTLIEKGVAKSVVFDRPTAKEAGRETTGHSSFQPSSSGPFPSALILRPGDVEAADLLKVLDQGILVTQLHYTNLMDPKDVTVTGLTRNGTFLVENGEIVAPVQNMRFTMSLVEAFSKVRGLGREDRLVEAFFGGATIVPSLILESFRFTSATRF